MGLFTTGETPIIFLSWLLLTIINRMKSFLYIEYVVDMHVQCTSTWVLGMYALCSDHSTCRYDSRLMLMPVDLLYF